MTTRSGPPTSGRAQSVCGAGPSGTWSPTATTCWPPLIVSPSRAKPIMLGSACIRSTYSAGVFGRSARIGTPPRVVAAGPSAFAVGDPPNRATIEPSNTIQADGRRSMAGSPFARGQGGRKRRLDRAGGTHQLATRAVKVQRGPGFRGYGAAGPDRAEKIANFRGPQ